jgi:hypothetical protein
MITMKTVYTAADTPDDSVLFALTPKAIRPPTVLPQEFKTH